MADPLTSAIAAPLAWGAGMVRNNQAVANTAKGMVSSAVSGATLPGDVYNGKVDPNSRQGFARAQDLAGSMAGGGMLTSDAPKGATGMFIGMKSPMWNKDNFRGAMELTANGAGRNEILEKTGTSRIPGGHWAQEVSDHDSMFKPTGMPKTKGVGDYLVEVQKEHPGASQMDQYTVAKALAYMQKPVQPVGLPDVLHHNTLLDAYPELHKMPVGVEYNPLMAGKYVPATMFRGPQLKLNPEKFGMLDTTLHEIQHHIQQREGWPQGGDPSMFEHSPWKEHLRPGEDIHQAYERLAGEELARATEKRRLLTPAERRQYLPDVHMDNPFPDQIIRR